MIIGDINKLLFSIMKREVNKLNIGPMGLGGIPTALAVFIETKPCHIASMPVAINVQCHSCRRHTIII